jgi:hypothetical protein
MTTTLLYAIHTNIKFMNLSIKKDFNSFGLIYSTAMNKDGIKNPWTTLSGEVKYDNKWINVTEYQVINPGGGYGI